MHTRFNARGVSHVIIPCLLLMLSAFGCAAANNTQLEVHNDPRGTAKFQFREINWRPASNGGVEMIGYGLVPFLNDPISRDWDSRYPRTGHVTLRLLIQPEVDGRYAITMLGPSTSMGPGDDEVLTASAANVSIETSDGDKRTLHFSDMPTQSRNRPGMKLTMNGVIIATPTSGDNFERQLRQFELELSYRGPTPKP